MAENEKNNECQSLSETIPYTYLNTFRYSSAFSPADLFNPYKKLRRKA